MPEYLPLVRIDSPEKLKQVFVDAITGHHWVWKASRVLHRDVSYGNIMFYREKSASGEQKVVGVLADWDFAEEQTDEPVKAEDKRMAYEAGPDSARHQEVQKRQKAKYRTGTGPFRSFELLCLSPPPAHLYRHDLESFFWVLAWFCAVFDPILHTVGFVPAWHQSHLKSVGLAKREFLEVDSEFDRVCSKTHPTYKPVINAWVENLRIRMSDVKNHSALEREYLARYFKYLDRKGPRNSEVRAQIINEAHEEVIRARTKLNNLVTYEYFMTTFDLELEPLE
ncbi:hypothetical protein EUX98_g9103 [Antrodiella citrinella]|uniref:Fungal-type protein kinase domain-containing protein n=1 Tax=Antrodiella citrinella TaxID=2447956 RepID=A0A4S4M0B4_9APHY|nr:hypothetical protein EUX98_g9103 [Antrodiella citrinella]